MINITPNKREKELDIARGIAIILMIVQHFWLVVISGFVNNEWVNFFFFLLGTVLAAPVFLFLMGVNISNSRHTNSSYFLKRGLVLIALGYILSALRFFLPLSLAQYLNLITSPETVIYKIWPVYYLLQVDILQLAGLSLTLISLLKKIKADPKYYLVTALIISIVSPLLWGLRFNSVGLNLITDLLWGNYAYITFPFFSWAFYPLVGVYFGNLLKEYKNKLVFYQKSLTLAKFFSFFTFFLFFIDLLFLNSTYYNQGVSFNLFFVSIVVAWISFIALNYKKLSLKITNFLSILSQNVTLIYFIQWILIGWLAVAINTNF